MIWDGFIIYDKSIFQIALVNYFVLKAVLSVKIQSVFVRLVSTPRTLWTITYAHRNHIKSLISFRKKKPNVVETKCITLMCDPGSVTPLYIDLGDGCWGRFMLVTSLRCWWPALNVYDQFFRLKKRSHRGWWWVLETKCVLTTWRWRFVPFWSHKINYLFTLTSATNIQTMSPRSKFCHQHIKLSPTLSRQHHCHRKKHQHEGKSHQHNVTNITLN